MISRTEKPGDGRPSTGRLLLWIVAAVALGVGIAIALRYGPAAIPILDTLH